MSNKNIKRRAIADLAEVTGWKLEGAESIVESVYTSKLITKHDEFLRICLENRDSSELWNKVVKFLFGQIKGDLFENRDALTKVICDLLRHIEPCFDYLYAYMMHNDNFSLEIFNESEDNFLIDPRNLTSVFVNSFLEHHESAAFGLEIGVIHQHRQQLCLDVVSQVGFFAFNIRAFRSLVWIDHSNPYALIDKKSFLLDLDTALHKYLHTKFTDNRYWLFYTLVEKLRKSGFGLRESFRKAGTILNEKPGSIARRYFDRKKEAKRNKLNLDEIITQYRLGTTLNYCLTVKLRKLSQ